MTSEKAPISLLPQVWSSSALVLLLRAREQARLRRQEWEDWAVEKHGSLQAAYSNPRVKVPKLEELLVEEWGCLRPHQAGMSAYSLHGYLRSAAPSSGQSWSSPPCAGGSTP